MKSPEVNATFAEMAAHYGVADESPSRPKNRRIAASSFAIRSVAGTCSPGHSVAIMIVFFDVS
ncbi:MAG: hypothetical protein ACRDOD_05105, partial [Streptosporangiaceae bacterium]